MSQEEFTRYEDMAIDGRLIYDEYPAEEYKYFSQLSRLGYKNRHEGWSKEICEDKQAEYKREYLHSKERNGRFSGKPALCRRISAEGRQRSGR